MNWIIFVQKFLAYGCIGLLIEVFFTGVYSVAIGNKKATCQTYLYTLPIYAITAFALEGVSEAVPWPFYVKAFLYVPIIYGAEALSGFCLKRIIGVIPWDYGRSKFTPFGLINLKYIGYWLALAMVFDPLSQYIHRCLNFLAKME